jgi:hypothetical protein
MDSLTKGSGIAVSVLVAATASILLLLPGHPETTPSGSATSGLTMASAAATSSPAALRPGGMRLVTRAPAPDRRPPGSRPACRTAGGHGSPAGPGRRAALRDRDGGPGPVRPGSCHTARRHRHQEVPGRLP